MNENLDLTEILKDCPKGTKLYSPIFGDVYLDKIRPYLAIVVTTNKKQSGFKEEFLYDGRYGMNGECMIFPSKEQRDWSKWQRPFVKGDILVSNAGNIVLCSHIDENQLVHYHCILKFSDILKIRNDVGVGYSYECTLANDFQKQKLFDALKKEGYGWNAETKTLEKLKKEKFDPKTLKPFESKVLVSTIGRWVPAIFGYYDKKHTNAVIVVGGNIYEKCIPYEGNEHLIDTFDQPSEFYRYWED